MQDWVSRLGVWQIWKIYKRLTDLSPISCHNSPAFLANSDKFKPGNLLLIRGRFSFIQRKYDDWFLYGCPKLVLILYPHMYFFIFSCMFLNPKFFFCNLNSNCSNSLDMSNLQEQVKNIFCYQKLLWTFNVQINCSSDLKILGLQPRISKVFSVIRRFFSHSKSKQFW